MKNGTSDESRAVNTISTEEAWLSSREAKEHLNVGATKFWSLVRDQAFPSYRVGRLHRFRRSDLDAFVEANRHRPDECW